VHQKEQRQAEEAAQKSADDDARRKRRADIARVFSRSLNKSKQKEELEDIAIVLALPEGGKKDELFQRISDHFEQHPDVKTNPRFEGLFNSRPSKQACIADYPNSTAGPSTVHRFMPPDPPPCIPGVCVPLHLRASEYTSTVSVPYRTYTISVDLSVDTSLCT
jgi:hypothetical protein